MVLDSQSDFLSDGISNVCIFQPCQKSHLQIWSWKFRSRSRSTTFTISISIEVVREHFSLFSWYSHFKIHDIENVGQGHDVQHSQCRIWWKKPDFLSDGNSDVCYISHHLWDIMLKVWPWRSWSKRRETGLAPFDWKCPISCRWIVSEFLLPGHIRLRKLGHAHTHSHTRTHARANTHIHMHTQRNGCNLMTKGESCNALQICLISLTYLHRLDNRCHRFLINLFHGSVHCSGVTCNSGLFCKLLNLGSKS